MNRTILDAEFEEWEVFASAGHHGYPSPARLVFRSVSNAALIPRAVDFPGDKAEAERAVVEEADADLLTFLQQAEPLP